jgi:hypothetical protein
MSGRRAGAGKFREAWGWGMGGNWRKAGVPGVETRTRTYSFKSPWKQLTGKDARDSKQTPPSEKKADLVVIWKKSELLQTRVAAVNNVAKKERLHRRL